MLIPSMIPKGFLNPQTIKNDLTHYNTLLVNIIIKEFNNLSTTIIVFGSLQNFTSL